MAAMGLDNGATQREPNAHTLLFRSKKRLEKPVSILGVEANSRILDKNGRLITVCICP
jgi:hypothetical protein